MKKVLFLIHDLSVGGAEKVLVNLVNFMDKTRYDVTVMTLFDVGVNRQFLNKDVHYKYCFKHMLRGHSKGMLFLTPKQLHRWLIKDRYDIEVAYLEGPCARIISGCEDGSVKLVSWIHREQKTVQYAKASFRSYKEAENCYGRFDRIVGVSGSVKEDFRRLFHIDVPMEVLYNTNDTKKILEQAKISPKDLSENIQEIRILGMGKIIKSKGFDRLARIHVRLCQEGYKIHTYILGVGNDRESIEKYIESVSMQDSFTFLGYQTNPYQYLARSDLFVCASFAEGFSTAATEALILGVPVVTTLVAGMKEMLGENNQYGIITENNEEALYQGIREMLEEKTLCHYKEMAALRGADFGTEKTVKAVEEMFERVLKEQ